MSAPAPNTPTTLAEWATHYAIVDGLEVFPCNPQKEPYTTNGMHDATSDPDTIRAWWQRWPDALIGCRIPADLIVLDIDPRHGGDATWKALQDEHSELPYTRRHASGRGDGGQHWWFRHPNPAGKLTVRKLNQWAQERGHGHEVGTKRRSWSGGIDILRHGHRYTILPPSPHPETGQPYRWTVKATPAAMPTWLAGMLTADEPTAEPALRVVRDSDGVADWFTANHSWRDILEPEGWRIVHGDGDSDGSEWRHPNATASKSATIKNGCLFVYSPNTDFEVTETDDPHGYTRFRAWATFEHDSNLTAAAAAAYELRDGPRAEPRDWLPEFGTVPPTPGTAGNSVNSPDTNADLARWFVQWPDMWAKDHTSEDWLVEPLLAAGRGHSLYAGAKSGKSLLMLEVAAALATGRPVLNRPASPPIHVLYVDYEMTEDDLRERLETFGYGPTDDLSHFHYALLPSIPGLDTPQGGRIVAEAAQAFAVELVVIDTLGRAVEGEENDNDTVRLMYRHTGLLLKAAHIAYIRLDHAGKDTAKGQRGASAKNDDVDVVWKFTRKEGGATLEATHRRMAWIPEKVDLALVETAAGLRHQPAPTTYPEGTKAVVDKLDELEVPLDWGRPRVKTMLTEVGFKCRDVVLSAAIKHRKETARNALTVMFPESGNSSQPTPTEQPNGNNGTAERNPRSEPRNSNGNSAEQLADADGNSSPSLGGNSSRMTPTDLI